MKLAFVITRGDELGGAQVHVRDLMEGLRSEGVDSVCLAGHAGPFLSDLARRGFETVALRHMQREIAPLADLRAVIELRRALARVDPDLVGLHASKAGILGRLAALGLGRPTVLTVHGWSFGQGVSRRRDRAYRLIERGSAALVHHFIVVSDYDARRAAEVGIPPYRVTRIHNGVVDVDARARPGAGRPRVVMVARMAAPKRHDRLLEALGGLQTLDWELEFIGTGPLEDALRRQVAAAGLDERVVFSGQCTDVPTRLSRASVFALCSDHEGFPLSVLEAMRAGLPILTEDVGGVREAVQEGVSGYLVPIGDVARLRERMRVLLGDASAREQMGAAARADFSKRFDFRVQLEATKRVYAHVLGRASLT